MEKVAGEVFIVDNNSIDGSVEMVKQKFPDYHLIENKENTGFSRANNQAMRIAKGEYVLLLNPDTVVEEDTFAQCIEFMDQHPKGGGLGVKMIDGKGIFLPESKRGLPTPSVAFYKIFGLSRLFPKSKRFGQYHLGYLDKDEVHEVEILSGAFMLMRKETLDQVGLLDEDFFMYGEDIDLSYRIIKGGYKNYYFPKTRIIHYKGESTKKSSVNYVFVFYNAMVIFARKHFSEKNARSFSFLINLAIYLRAGMAVTNRFLKKAIAPLIDFILTMVALYGVTFGYAQFSGKVYDWDILKWAIPAYSASWILGVLLLGGYDKPLRFFNILKGLTLGTICILVVYALLPKSVQFSRVIILLGAASTTIVFLLLRGLYDLMRLEGFSFRKKVNTKFAVIGLEEEANRVKELIAQITGVQHEVSLVFPDEQTKRADYRGNLSQLNEIAHIHKVDEIIFCAKDISSQKIIELMSTLDMKDMEYKIAQPETLYLIGSNSIDTSGDLYMIQINAINLPGNVRNKRFFDFFTALFLLLLLPISIWLPESKSGFIRNVFQVLIGKKTWVGFQQLKHDDAHRLPKIRKGILSPTALSPAGISPDKIRQLHLIYAKDYRIGIDFKIVFRSMKRLGNSEY